MCRNGLEIRFGGYFNWKNGERRESLFFRLRRPCLLYVKFEKFKLKYLPRDRYFLDINTYLINWILIAFCMEYSVWTSNVMKDIRCHLEKFRLP